MGFYWEKSENRSKLPKKQKKKRKKRVISNSTFIMLS